MFFINEANQKKPIAVWLENIEQIVYGTEGKQIITEPQIEPTPWWEFWK